MTDQLPYQIGPQVAALQQERANCVAYGNDVRVASIDRQLAELGVKQAAAEKRSDSADDSRYVAPKGRRGKESTLVNADAAEARGDA